MGVTSGGRQTGYKWAARYDARGANGLADRSRALLTFGHATRDALVGRILLSRREYGWGANKLLQVLQARFPAEAWPARSTVNAILDLEEVDDGIWNIVYYRTLLGKIDERTSRITGTTPGQ